MADRQVTQSGKDREGDITKLCNPSGAWSPRSKAGAIADIEDGLHSYYVMLLGGIRANVRVVKGDTGKYLRTDRDTSTTNNLDELPDC